MEMRRKQEEVERLRLEEEDRIAALELQVSPKFDLKEFLAHFEVKMRFCKRVRPSVCVL